MKKVEEGSLRSKELKVKFEQPFPKSCKGKYHGGIEYSSNMFLFRGGREFTCCMCSEEESCLENALHLWVFPSCYSRESRVETTLWRRLFGEVGVGCWAAGSGNNSGCSDYFFVADCTRVLYKIPITCSGEGKGLKEVFCGYPGSCELVGSVFISSIGFGKWYSLPAAEVWEDILLVPFGQTSPLQRDCVSRSFTIATQIYL